MIIYENDSICDVVRDAERDNYPFILKGEIETNNSDPSDINSFFKDINQLNKTIEELNDKYDETQNIHFTGEMIKYTTVFNRISGSNYGTGCDSFKKIIQYNGFCVYTGSEGVFQKMNRVYIGKRLLTRIS